MFSNRKRFLSSVITFTNLCIVTSLVYSTDQYVKHPARDATPTDATRTVIVGLPEVNCRVYDWVRMTCSWDLLNPEANYTLGYIRERVICDPEHNYTSCHVSSSSSCTWFFNPAYGGNIPSKNYNCFLLTESTSPVSGTGSRSSCKCLKIKDLVELAPVVNLVVTNISRSSIWLNWKLQTKLKDIILYRITYESQWQKLNVTTSNTSIQLNHLTAGTEYNITVDCRPLQKQQSDGIGFWSSPVSVSRKTLDDVPGMAPSVTVGSFYISSLTQRERSVTLLWKAVPETMANGKIVETRLKYRNVTLINDGSGMSPSSAWSIATSFGTSYSFRLDIDVGYQFDIDSRTSAGFNESLLPNTIHVQPQKLMPLPPKDFTVLVNGSQYYANWSTATGDYVSYTLYWCVDVHTSPCLETPMNWRILPATDQSTHLIIPGSENELYIFGLSVEVNISGAIVSSGITWADCIHDIKKYLLPPSNLRASPNQDGRSLNLEWTSPNCYKSGYISHFIVSYCRRRDCTSNSDWITLRLSSSLQFIRITDLQEEEEYSFRIKSWSPYGASKFSPILTVIIPRSGLSNGHLAAIVIGVLVVVVCICIVLYKIIRRFNKMFWKKVDILLPSLALAKSKDASSDSYSKYTVSTMLKENDEDCADRPIRGLSINRYDHLPRESTQLKTYNVSSHQSLQLCEKDNKSLVSKTKHRPVMLYTVNEPGLACAAEVSDPEHSTVCSRSPMQIRIENLCTQTSLTSEDRSPDQDLDSDLPSSDGEDGGFLHIAIDTLFSGIQIHTRVPDTEGECSNFSSRTSSFSSVVVYRNPEQFTRHSSQASPALSNERLSRVCGDEVAYTDIRNDAAVEYTLVGPNTALDTLVGPNTALDTLVGPNTALECTGCENTGVLDIESIADSVSVDSAGPTDVESA